MRYTVVYESLALKSLARLWMAAANRQEVSDASDEIDYLLRTSPVTNGIPSGGLYRLMVPPLEVLYGISPDDCLVRIFAVRLATQP
jgi:hypothetical protein